MLENLDISTIITIGLGVVSTFAGGFWLKSKGKFKELITLTNAGFSLLKELEAALDDNKITKDEIRILRKRAKLVRSAWEHLVR